MNQAELRRMAEERLQDTEALIAGGRQEFAYYTAGYAVECALKSCVLTRMVVTGWVFDEEVTKVSDCRTHEFLKLIRIAGMRDELDNTLKDSATAGGEFVANWNTVSKWKVTSRYEVRTEAEARDIFAAITDEPYGVLTWIRNFW